MIKAIAFTGSAVTDMPRARAFYEALKAKEAARWCMPSHMHQANRTQYLLSPRTTATDAIGEPLGKCGDAR